MLHHLTLGRNKPDGGYVTDLDWQMYCQEVLDSNFDGYTIQDATGTWKSDQEAVGHYVTSPMEFI